MQIGQSLSLGVGLLPDTAVNFGITLATWRKSNPLYQLVKTWNFKLLQKEFVSSYGWKY